MLPLGSVVCGLILLCAVFWLVRWRREQKRERIFEIVERGQLIPDVKGVIFPPANLASVSCDGKAYVTRRGNLLMVFLPTWFGKASNVQGALMCNRTLTTDDVDSDAYSGETTIKILYPQWLGLNGPHAPATGLIAIRDLEQSKWGRIKHYTVVNDLS